MAAYQQFPRGNGRPAVNWIGIIIMLVVLIGLFVLARGIFRLLMFLAPIMLIATLIIDYKVVLDYVKQLGGLFKRNPLYGLGATAFTIVLYPIVFATLLFRAVTRKQLARFTQGRPGEEEEFVEYEEVEEDFLDLDEMGKVKETRQDRYFNGD